ncbi:hypothetical protein PENANT_c013G09355 [Penicillium antarcticum]|uniref:Uncharacterized protein n=1 Tax=Penicillium antarcticum TaxID=416450 RepID=A0A1V6Q4Y3_9EURO|nr:hypothetical protein PENANT_c013G09355 [Penicillium antarcticum]
MPIDTSSQDKGVTGAAKFVTSTFGNTVGGVTRTLGGVTGTAGRGIGDTITSATGSTGEPVGNMLGSATTGLEDGAKQTPSHCRSCLYSTGFLVRSTVRVDASRDMKRVSVIPMPINVVNGSDITDVFEANDGLVRIVGLATVYPSK